MKEWIWRWGPAALVMAIIFVVSGAPGSDLPKFGTWDLYAKKGGHMLGYALLSCAFFHALNKGGKITKTQFFASVCLACLYAISDEFHQRFTPGRTSSIHDVGIDTLGAAIGVALWNGIRKLRKAEPQASSCNSNGVNP